LNKKEKIEEDRHSILRLGIVAGVLSFFMAPWHEVFNVPSLPPGLSPAHWWAPHTLSYDKPMHKACLPTATVLFF